MSRENNKFYITSPLYYVNDVPHIGSAYTTIACDCIARYKRLRGYDVCFLTGTDEHGQKIFKSALEQKLLPQEHCDFITGKFQELWKLLNIKYNKFSRTTSKKHELIVQEFFNVVFKRGDIYEADYEGLYCEACEDFKSEKELLDGKICPIHKLKAQEYKEKNYFFALSKYQDKLVKHFEENPDFIQPSHRKNEVLGWVKEGLKDFPISRQSVSWGIPIPNDSKQTIYVWFDALLGYISGLLDDTENSKVENAIKKYWPCSVHIIGKDILRFHAVYWPCMLMSANLPLPKKVFGHGFLTKDGEKMGKTTGNIINPHELINEFGTDAVRFYFLREISFGKDGDFSRDNFINRINSDLANNLGNLLNRALNLVNKNFNGVIEEPGLDNILSLKEKTVSTINNFESHMDNLELKEALDSLWQLVDATNKAFNNLEPWKLIKNNEKDKAKCCLYETLEILRNISILVSPFIPETSLKMYNQLGCDRLDENNEWKKVGWKKLKASFTVKEGKPIFPRVEEQKSN
ncbi:MAG: methionine--tRNA ligase [Candidatus Melainabacteria bacterium]|nr:methionine--tRNA ligase [Candidatus Melainabacteria bacterium]